MLESLIQQGYQILALHHAEAILSVDMPEALVELEEALSGFEIPISELVKGGGGEAQSTQRLRRELAARGWQQHNFEVKKIVDGVEKESTSHEIDHVKAFPSGTFALEIEWNNKDPFFDRDLENFKRLHAEGAISIGSIITRGATLQAELRSKVCEFARTMGVTSLRDLSQFVTIQLPQAPA